MLLRKEGSPGRASSSAARACSTRAPGSTPSSTSASTNGVIAADRRPARHERAPGRRRDGLVLAPAFVDPHVHLRTPGREDEETIASGTGPPRRAATARSWRCRTPSPWSTRRPCSASLVGRRESGGRDPGRLPRRDPKGQQGAELTEMAELADAGAAGFTDDGRPVVSAALMRRALQYAAITGRPLAVHCEEPTLSRGGHMHEGRVSAELGFARLPVGRREPDGQPRSGARDVRRAAAPSAAPLRAGVGRGP